MTLFKSAVSIQGAMSTTKSFQTKVFFAHLQQKTINIIITSVTVIDYEHPYNVSNQSFVAAVSICECFFIFFLFCKRSVIASVCEWLCFHTVPCIWTLHDQECLNPPLNIFNACHSLRVTHHSVPASHST